MSYMSKRTFDVEGLSIILITPIPLEISEGLILQETFMSIEKLTKDLVGHKVGLGGEVLVNEKYDMIHTLTLTYLPTAPAVVELGLLEKLKTQFGLMIKNNSAPRYRGFASECRILNKPDIAIGIGGYKDLVWKIIMADYVDAYTGSL